MKKDESYLHIIMEKEFDTMLSRMIVYECRIEYDEKGRLKHHENEIRMAIWLEEHYGGDITVLRETNTLYEKTADFLWNGRLWELKTVTSLNAADGAVRRAVKQIEKNPGGIILDYQDSAADFERVKRVIARRLQRINLAEVQVIIVSDGKLVDTIEK